MREKLLKLMEMEGLTASRLAELLGIRSSGISHIISERNKPSFDLLQKIFKRFPNINPDWLLLDSDQMYRDANATTTVRSAESSMFTEFDDDNASAETSAPLMETPTNGQPSQSTQQLPLEIGHLAKNSSRGVKRVIVLFDDHTFESYEVR